MIKKEWLASYGGVAMMLFCIGCSDTIKIHGTVTYSDGSPVTHGCVIFECGQEAALGMLNETGHYRLGRLKDGDGIKPGQYSVWLTGTEINESKIEGSGLNVTTTFSTMETVHKKFTRKATSNLTFEAKPGGPKTFDFIIERPE